MNVSELKSMFLSAAKECGICTEGLKRLSGCADLSELISYYVENPDWCIEHGFPSLETLREMKSTGMLDGSGIFVDEDFSGTVLDEHQVYIFHHCTGAIKTGLNVAKAIIPMFYLANDSQLFFEEKDRDQKIKVPVYCSEDSSIVYFEEDGRLFRFHRIKREEP